MTSTKESRKELSDLFNSTIIVFMGRIFSLGIVFLGQILIARFLGAYSFGAISLGVLLMTSISTVALIGMDTGVGRYLSRYDKLGVKREILLSAICICIPVSLLIGLIFVLLSESIALYIFGDKSITKVIYIFSIAIPFAVLYKFLKGSVRGLELPKYKVYIDDILRPMIQIILIAGAIVLGFQATGVAAAYVVMFAVGSLLLLLVVNKNVSLFKLSETQIKGPSKKELLLFSSPLMLTSLMTTGFTYIDRVFIAQFGTTADVGIYSGIYKIATLLLVIVSSINFLFLPIFSKLHSDKEYDKMREMYKMTTKWAMLLTTPLLFILLSFPGVVILMTYGQEFLNGKLVMVILLLGMFTHVVSGLNRSALKAIGMVRIVTLGTGIVFVLNIMLNAILVPRYSIMGAAVATTSSYLIWNIYYLFIIRKKIGSGLIDMKSIEITLILLSVFIPASVAANNVLENQIISLIFILPIFFISYLVIVLFVLIGEEDLIFIRKLEEEKNIGLNRVIKIVEKYSLTTEKI